MEKHNYKMAISYDGTFYFGWQTQLNKITIQATIEKSIKIILQKDIKIIGAGRTDAKVHANCQVANFFINEILDISNFLYRLNSLLPKDIRILKIEKTNLSFHSRFSAKTKIYRYHLSLIDIQSPFSRNYAYKPIYKIDKKLLKEATKHFMGTNNFSSFANSQNMGSAKANPIKTIYRIDLIETLDGLILEFEGDGFLYKMIRNIVGTLLDVASKKLPIGNIIKIIKAKDRKKASSPVPGHALFLHKITYKSDFSISSKDLK